MIYNIPTDHQQAAIEAAANSLRQIEPNLYQNPYNPQQYYGGLAQDAIAAAEPHLRRKWAEEVREKVNPPDVDYSHEWRRGFTVGAIKAASNAPVAAYYPWAEEGTN